MNLVNDFSILVSFSKNQLFPVLIFASVYFISFSFICSDAYDFFPSTTFGGLLFFFSSCFRCKLRLFI